MINEFRPMNHLTSLQNLICTIGNLPTSYALSLSYEEQIWWLCDFLEKKVFPAIEENTNITEETKQAFIELQNYVRDYFNNLDVQEEINNKLDEMFSTGELTTSILNILGNKLDSFSNSNKINVLENLVTDNTLWILNNGWTGNQQNGFSHIIGQSSPLVYNKIFSANKSYLVSFDVSTPLPAGGENAGNDFSVIIGNSEPIVTYRGGGSMHYEIALKPTQEGTLQFICVEASDPYTSSVDFNGTISNISVKELTGSIEQLFIKDRNNLNSLGFTISENNQDNVAIGINSLKSNYNGNGNVFLGANSGNANISGFYNVGVGYMALGSNINGSRNVAIGFDTLVKNETGDRNIAIGGYALAANVTGRKNIALGFDTLDNLKTGQNNLALGNQALQSATNTSNNIAIGTGAMLAAQPTGNANIALGNKALNYLTQGSNNIAIGNNSLYKNKSGRNNIGIGSSALSMNETAENIIAIGTSIGSNISSGEYSILIGQNNSTTLNIINNSLLIANKVNSNIDELNNSILIGTGIAGQSTHKIFNDVVCINSGYETQYVGNDHRTIISKCIFIDTSSDLKKLGLQIESPTARLHIGGGRAESGTAPIKINQGTLNTVPENGAFEFDGTHLYFTIGNNRNVIV